MYAQEPRFRRFSKAEIYEAIACDCFNKTGVQVSTIVKLEECPSSLRHSCFATGVIALPQYLWQVPSEYGDIYVPYYFCPQCGKLYIEKNIYE